MHGSDIWSYREDTGYDPMGGRDITGYGVEAIDGSIGKIHQATSDVGTSFVIVDTGPWIFGKKVMLPAGVVERIDPDDEKVWINRTKDQIKNAPEFDDSRGAESAYRDRLGGYYGQGGAGHQDWNDPV